MSVRGGDRQCFDAATLLAVQSASAKNVTKYDVVVIGTGAAASTTAMRCRKAGKQVAVVDSRPFGGTCALRGCDPKKVLVGAAELLDWNRRMREHGIRADSVSVDWPRLMQFKRSFIESVLKNSEESFVKRGVATVHGTARFVGPTSLQVGDKVLDATNVVIAAGAKPIDLKIPGSELAATSEQFLGLERLPERILFIGGGYISFEFAHIAARSGARVMVLHRGLRPLERFDPDLVDRLVTRTRDLGVDIRLGLEVTSIARSATGISVRAHSGTGDHGFDTDLVVHGAGRVPEIDDMRLNDAGIEWDPNTGVKVNEYLQSVSNSAVYAAGDAAATAGTPLTPVASYEGRIAAENLLKGNHRKPNYDGIPTVVFTIPQLASVGLQERTARDRGLAVRVNQEDTSSWYSSRRVAERYSGFKTLIDEQTGRIFGAHLLGPDAAETINIFALAIRKGLTSTDLKDVIYAYPTVASDVPYMI
jgi:glutathione reductase (NADPH)